MLTRPAGHKAKAQAEARKSGAEDEAEKNFFEAEATMYEACLLYTSPSPRD